MDLRKIINWYLTPSVILGALITAGILSVIVFLVIFLSKPSSSPSGQGTALINVIRNPSPTATLPTQDPVIQATTTPATPGALPGEINIGAVVKIFGTGEDGLRLRSNPGLSGQILYIASEGDIYLVSDGPVEGDGYTWWRLVNQDDSSIEGWAVVNFLELVENP